MRSWSALAVVLMLGTQTGLTVACGGDTHPSIPPEPSAELQVLFVGNSLTAANDLPAMVWTVAEAAGESFAARTVAVSNFSLEDHWRQGRALEVIREEWADVVVMQQGPSSLPQNQLHLRRWAARFAGEVRDAGGRPALYMVWPSESRSGAFDDVSRSYAAAAEWADALLMPAGDAWRAAWRRSPGLGLYGPDGFHPSDLGSFVAALTVFRCLYDRPVTELPDTLRPATPGLPTLVLSPEIASLVREAVEEAVASHR